MKGASTPLVNDSGLVERLQYALEQLLGEGSVMTNYPTLTASEDAHLLLGEHVDIPVNYMFVGIVSPNAWAESGNRPPYFNHNPHFKVELDSIPIGTKIGTIATLELLAK